MDWSRHKFWKSWMASQGVVSMAIIAQVIDVIAADRGKGYGYIPAS
jgi:hypothetical protein